MFKHHFRMSLTPAGIMCEAVDEKLSVFQKDGKEKHFNEKILVPKTKSLVRIRCLIARMRLAKLWRMAKRGRFINCGDMTY